MKKQRLIRSLNYDSERFQRTFEGLKPDVMKEARRAFGEMILTDIDNPPAKLHLHALAGREVKSALAPQKRVKIYTVHITSNDSYKASFTFEDGCAYMRCCGPHDDIDKNP